MHRPLTPPQHRTLRLSDGYQAFARYWPATRPDTGVILYLHGIQSHGGWYEWSASWLAAETGFGVLLPDRRGSGRNAAARGDVSHAGRWFDDLDEHIADLQASAGVTRVALVGVSWGGKLAVAYAARRGRPLAGLLLIAPGIYPAVDVGIGARLRIAANLLLGGRKRFPIPLSDPALFTQNLTGQDFIRSDDLKLADATARFFYHSRRLDAWVRRPGIGRGDSPAMLVLAGRDRIIRSEQTAAWFRLLAGKNAELRTLSEASHTIEFEARLQDFENVLREWARMLTATGACSAEYKP